MRTLSAVRLSAVVAALVATTGSARPPARDMGIVHDTVAVDEAGGPIPFHVGEKLTYQAKVNFLHAGSATMEILGTETIRGHQTFHAAFDVNGGALFVHVHDHYETWFDTSDMVSYRHEMKIDETSYHDDRHYEFYPERQVYVRDGKEYPSVAKPLDEASFVYFLRTIPLEVGRTYSFNRYYHQSRNPVLITVLRREHIKVPAGEFDAVVVHPIIKSRGLFSEKGDAEVWFATDSTHRLLRLKSKLSFGTLYLELKQIQSDTSR